MSEEGESPLHIRVGKSLEMEAEGWRLGILAGMGMGISEATGTDIGNNGGSLGSLGYAEPRLGRLGMLGMLGKDLAISQNPRGGMGREKDDKKEKEKGDPVISRCNHYLYLGTGACRGPIDE